VVVRLVVVGVVVVVEVVLLRCPRASSLVGTRHKVTAENGLLLEATAHRTASKKDKTEARARQAICPELRMSK